MPTHSKSLVLVSPPQQGLLDGFSSGLVPLANYVAAAVPDLEIHLCDLTQKSTVAARGNLQSLCHTAERVWVGITTTTASYQSALRIAALVKEIRPDAVVMLGGHHATPEVEQVLSRHDVVDYVVRGEGEIALSRLTSGSEPHAVPNLSYRCKDGHLTHNPPAPLLQTTELDRLSPCFDLHGTGGRETRGKFDHVTYVTARGCPLRCTFCAVSNNPVRCKSPEAVVSDIRHYVLEHHFRKFAIEDNWFAQSAQRTLAICEGLTRLRRELTFEWDCQTRVESLRRPDVIEAMARAGCTAVYIGVEALEPRDLLFLGKTRSPETYIASLDSIVIPKLASAGIDTYINLQAGLPHDNLGGREVTLRTLTALGETIRKFGRSITVFPQLHVVYPGTTEWSRLRAGEDRVPLPADLFEDFTLWESDHQPVLSWLSRHFAHGTGGLPISILSSRDLFQPRPSFSIDMNAVLEIDRYLDDVSTTRGITVFKYLPHLTAGIQ